MRDASLRQDHAKAALGPAVVAEGSSAAASPSLTSAILAAGAVVVLEPGFAHLLDMIPPLGASDGTSLGAGAATGASEGGPRQAAISRWASLTAKRSRRAN